MTTATATKAPMDDLPFVMNAERFNAHQADMVRRQKERDAKRPLLMACLNPAVAAAKEAEKPVYQYHVRAKFEMAIGGEIEALELDEKVAAQSEDDAWATACDRVQTWPSRRIANPTFKKIKQLTATEITAGIEVNLDPDKPRRKLVPKPWPKSGR